MKKDILMNEMFKKLARESGIAYAEFDSGWDLGLEDSISAIENVMNI
jgi:hypothetical protein